ncbi:MAG: TetR/AcrR family transcriptional regulator C-terminal domain-containing protein [Bacillota bacterium]
MIGNRYEDKIDILREPLDRVKIIQAALDLLNEVGLQQLTMRRLAESLGIKAASLYWHVTDKGELMQLLADNICDRIFLPEENRNWRELVVSLSNQYRNILLSIRDSAEILVDTVPATPRRLRVIENMFGILYRAGFSPQEVVFASGLINNYVLSFVMDEMRLVRMASDKGKSVEEALSDARKMFQGLSLEEYPNIVGLAEHATCPDMDKQFYFGLQVLLDGLAVRLAARSEDV